MKSRAYGSAFGFTGSDQQKLVAHLSGRERNRLPLAKMLMTGGNSLDRLDARLQVGARGCSVDHS